MDEIFAWVPGKSPNLTLLFSITTWQRFLYLFKLPALSILSVLINSMPSLTLCIIAPYYYSILPSPAVSHFFFIMIQNLKLPVFHLFPHHPYSSTNVMFHLFHLNPLLPAFLSILDQLADHGNFKWWWWRVSYWWIVTSFDNLHSSFLISCHFTRHPFSSSSSTAIPVVLVSSIITVIIMPTRHSSTQCCSSSFPAASRYFWI